MNSYVSALMEIVAAKNGTAWEVKVDRGMSGTALAFDVTLRGLSAKEFEKLIAHLLTRDA